MAKFLHEYRESRDGTRIDNGWWEIDGDRLVNQNEGWHYYNPSEDDEIKECEWEDIIRDTIRDDTLTTGWVSPDGTFYGCASTDHRFLAEYIFNMNEIELEVKGYAKIYENPIELRIEIDNLPQYEAMRADGHRMTKEQIKTIKDKGVNIKKWQ